MNSQFTRLVRILLGIILVAFGLNKFFHFIPLPALPENANNFMESLNNTGYVLPLVGILEVMIGALLLTKNKVALALLILVPISVNILLFHLFLDIPGLLGALVVVALNAILIYKNWPRYRPIFA
jgi:putative oxidoreductase